MPDKLKEITLAEVAQHNQAGDSWVVIDNHVYDVSSFANMHPGGRQVLLKHCGHDATEQFHVYHSDAVMRKYHAKLCIGHLVPDAAKEKKRAAAVKAFAGKTAFGDLIPYADPAWYQRFNSPFYKQTHVDWRAKVRAFVDKEIIATLDTWKNASRPPESLMLKMGEAGFLAALTGPPFPVAYLPPAVAAQEPKDFDYFHELILIDEISRCGHSGAVAALTNGPAIALTVVLRFGSEEMKKRVVPDVLMGRKFIGLAISEPQAGSDVAGLTATARRDGDHYIANGNKKWITNGTYSDYFSAAFRTGDDRGALSFFLVDAAMPGFSVRKVNIRDSQLSGTAYLDFDQCRIPAANLIGPENQGFKMIMYNFNHERFYVSAIALRLSRVCLEECIKYALRRNVFDQKLADIQTIRMKIAAMTRAIEAQQAWLESLVYQMCTMSHAEANEKLGDVISLVKVQASKVYELCARETTMVFGGNALYMDGVGRKIEAAVSQVKGYQIPAGAEDVMDDYAGRTAFKRASLVAKL